MIFLAFYALPVPISLQYGQKTDFMISIPQTIKHQLARRMEQFTHLFVYGVPQLQCDRDVIQAYLWTEINEFLSLILQDLCHIDNFIIRMIF